VTHRSTLSETTSTLTPATRTPQRLSAPVLSAPVLSAYVVLLSLLTTGLLSGKAWLRAERPTEDRGDATEKAFMIILAITVGTAVTVAAVAFVKTKTDLFK